MEQTLNTFLWMFGTPHFIFYSLVGLLMGYLFGIHHFLGWGIRFFSGLYREPITIAETLNNKKERVHTYMFLFMSCLYVCLYNKGYNFEHITFMIVLSMGYAFFIGYIFGTMSTQKKTDLRHLEEKALNLLRSVVRHTSDAHLSYWYGVFGISVGISILYHEATPIDNLFALVFFLSLLFGTLTRFVLTNKDGLVDYTKGGFDEREVVLFFIGILFSVVFSRLQTGTPITTETTLGIIFVTWGGILTTQSSFVDLFMKEKTKSFI